jgi:uncharacterized Zn-binding protein involved in type VI secretion
VYKKKTMPAAAKLHHVCPLSTPTTPPVAHVTAGQLIVASTVNVLINGSPAVIQGDTCVCLDAPNKVVGGSSSVMINNKPAARMGDSTTHGGTIDQGSPTVLIGG